MRLAWLPAAVAMLLCVACCLILFFPWVELQVVTFDPAAAQEPLPKGSLGHESLRGYQLWPGVASASVFLVAFVLLVITGSIRPAPAWRSVSLLACGVAALAALVAPLSFPPGILKGSIESGRLVIGYAWGYPHLFSLAGAGALVVLAAVELRGWVGRRVRTRHESVPDSAAASSGPGARSPE